MDVGRTVPTEVLLFPLPVVLLVTAEVPFCVHSVPARGVIRVGCSCLWVGWDSVSSRGSVLVVTGGVGLES